jgi:hypothetical protein
LVNTADDGFTDVAPVGCFAPNQNGLYADTSDLLGMLQNPKFASDFALIACH